MIPTYSHLLSLLTMSQVGICFLFLFFHSSSCQSQVAKHGKMSRKMWKTFLGGKLKSINSGLQKKNNERKWVWGGSKRIKQSYCILIYSTWLTWWGFLTSIAIINIDAAHAALYLSILHVNVITNAPWPPLSLWWSSHLISRAVFVSIDYDW